MTFGSTFGRTFSPTFQPKSQASGRNTWWDLNGTITSCVAAYQAKGAADLAASYINLANPGTYNAAPGTAPDWDATNGWKFNGTSHYLDTGITPDTNAWSAIIRFTNAPTSSARMFGSENSGTRRFWMIANYVSSRGWANLGSIFTGTGAASGTMAFAGQTGYDAGEPVTTEIPIGGDPVSYSVYIGTMHVGTGASNLLAYYCQAFALYNTTLTSTQIGLLTTAMNAL